MNAHLFGFRTSSVLSAFTVNKALSVRAHMLWMWMLWISILPSRRAICLPVIHQHARSGQVYCYHKYCVSAIVSESQIMMAHSEIESRERSRSRVGPKVLSYWAQYLETLDNCHLLVLQKTSRTLAQSKGQREWRFRDILARNEPSSSTLGIIGHFASFQQGYASLTIYIR
jgi:hypothetical protein